mgnify:CR=1 FL=1
MMKLGILGAGMIVREFLPWLTGPESPFKVEALCSTCLLYTSPSPRDA